VIITFFRSSSFNNFDICQQQYFLTYCLGLPQPSGKKAEIGTIVHKVLEGLAIGKLACQDGIGGGVHDKILGTLEVEPNGWNKEKYLLDLVERSFNYYQPKSVHKWWPRDRRKCDELVFKALEQGNGMFDPRKRTIIAAEPHFDIELPYEWAHYKWVLPDDTTIEGQLRLKGTVDLVLDGGDNLYEINDWKTGQRKNWATDEEKDYWALNKDPQLSIYHYALSDMFPDIKYWAATMNYIDHGGPYTCAYTEDDKVRTLDMLRKQFEKIKRCMRPSLRKGKDRWFCNRVCHYGKNDHSESKCGNSICWHIHQKLRQGGIQNVMAEETHPGFVIGTYDSPGE
jgi:hypothetical protein